MKKKLLISGLGGSLFPYLIDHLSDKYDLFFIDSNPLVLKMYPHEKVFIVPNAVDKDFDDSIILLIQHYGIDFYIPLIDEEVLKAIAIGHATDIKVLAPSKAFVILTLDKYTLMQELETQGISFIKTFMAATFDGSIDFPLFLKPNIGRGSRGIRKIISREQFDAYFSLESYAPKDVLVQPYIDGDEYTVSVTVNNLNQIIAIVPKLVLLKEGITKHARSVHHSSIEQVCHTIVDRLHPKGSFNVQLKIFKDEIFIFEINPRYSTTLVLSITSGINEIDLNIEHYDHEKVPYISHFQETELIRRWENLFYV